MAASQGLESYTLADIISQLTDAIIASGPLPQQERLLQRLRSLSIFLDKELESAFLSHLALALLQKGRPERILFLVAQIEHPYYKQVSLQSIAVALVAAGETGKALAITDKLTSSTLKAEALARMSAILSQKGAQAEAANLFARSFVEILKIEDSTEQVQALDTYAQALSQSRDLPERKQLVEQMIGMIEHTPSDYVRSLGLEIALPLLAVSGDTDLALQIYTSIKDQDIEINTLMETVSALSAAGYYEQAYAVTKAFGAVSFGADAKDVFIPMALNVILEAFLASRAKS